MTSVTPLIFAHRGDHRELPENTIGAFERAIAAGVDGIEIDVRVCRTGEVVVCHDPHLGRFTGSAAWVGHLPWSLLKRRSLGCAQFVPLLNDAIDLVLDAGLELNIELKRDVPNRRFLIDQVVTLLKARPARDAEQLILSTFDPYLLWALQTRYPKVRSAFLFDGAHTGSFRAELVRQTMRPRGLHPHYSLITPQSRQRWRSASFVCAWTVNDAAEMRRLADLDVYAFITDEITLAKQLLEVC